MGYASTLENIKERNENAASASTPFSLRVIEPKAPPGFVYVDHWEWAPIDDWVKSRALVFSATKP